MTIKDILSDGGKVFLNESVIRHAVDQKSPEGIELLQAIEQGCISGYFSVLSYSAIIGDQQDEYTSERVRLLLTHFPNLTILPIDEETADKAAKIHRKEGLPMMDSLLLASAIHACVDWIVSVEDDQYFIAKNSN